MRTGLRGKSKHKHGYGPEEWPVMRTGLRGKSKHKHGYGPEEWRSKRTHYCHGPYTRVVHVAEAEGISAAPH